MPMITVDVAAEPDLALAERLQQTVTALTAEILGKDPRVTAVAVRFVPPGAWFVAGRSAGALGTAAFFVEVRVTDGTNTKEEKAEYVARTFSAVAELLGGAHAESYVHVHDARADAYGYGGVTQERRWIERRVPAVAR